MAVNIGTLAAGIGSGIKNISTTIPTMQNQIQQAALRGAQQAQIDANLKDRGATTQAATNGALNGLNDFSAKGMGYLFNI